MAKFAKIKRGTFLKVADLVTGKTIQILDEIQQSPSNKYTDESGRPTIQSIGTVSYEGGTYLLRFNTQSTQALVDCYGEESKNWIGKQLTIHLEKTSIGGKRTVVPYLYPQGYVVVETKDHYINIVAANDVVDAEVIAGLQPSSTPAAE